MQQPIKVSQHDIPLHFRSDKHWYFAISKTPRGQVHPDNLEMARITELWKLVFQYQYSKQ